MQNYKELFIYYLNSLIKEIFSYKNEENIWKLSGEISNTSGNLCLHICGNLNHFFGAAIGNTGYVRERNLEFSKKNVSREDLIKGVEDTKIMMEKVLDSLTSNDLTKIYPLNQFGENVTYETVFLILISHLAYHVGQINYHRRILDNH